MRLSVMPPYNFHLTTSVYTRFPTQVADYYLEGKYRRVLRDSSQLFLLEVESEGKSDSPVIQDN